MEAVETKCECCGKSIYIAEKSVREKMFCTLGCLYSYNKNSDATKCHT